MIAATIMNTGTISGGGGNPDSPTAAFAPLSSPAYVGSPVALTDLSTGNPTSWTWYVNGMILSHLQNPIFYPPSQDSYTIYLVATNAFGSSTSASQILTVLNY